jgi:RNA polymerase sigma-70 factor, ECF subfamily
VGSSPGEVTMLLANMQKGDRDAAGKLMPVIYGELRRLAAHYMRSERPDHTLQPTALVHEAYVRLVENEAVEWQGKAHFMAVAAQLMRRILIDHARGHVAAKRGGRAQKVELEDRFAVNLDHPEELLALDEALTALTQRDARQGRVVELRFFGGLSVEETAEVLGIDPRTVKRDWSAARAWLHRKLRTDRDSPSGDENST